MLTVIAACPSGAMITILSLRYGVDETFATRVNFVSTVLCAGTPPLVTHIFYCKSPRGRGAFGGAGGL